MNILANLTIWKHWLSRGLSEIATIKRVSDGVVVTTHCMYPSNGLVQVTSVAGDAQSLPQTRAAL